MDAKISSTTWNDPDLENFTPEMLLTLHWMKTNPDRNDCGAYRFSPSRFTFETKGLDPSWHDKTRLALGDLVLNEGAWFLYLPFIRECLWLGPVRGKNKGLNRGWQALAKPFEGLPKPLRTPLLVEYPEFREVAWCHSLNDSDSDAIEEGVGKGLARGGPPPDQIRSDQIRSGESEGGESGAEIPSEEDVQTFAAAFVDLARGLGPIPEDYWMHWLAWRKTPKAGPFPRDWRSDLRLRFLGDAVQTRANGNTPPPARTTPMRSKRAELEEKLKNAPTQEERQKIRDDLQKLP